MLYDTQHGVLEFHFERIGFPSTIGYNVAVINGRNTTFNFTMQQKDAQWKIGEPSKLPKWIIELEEQLSDCLQAHITKTSSLF